MKFFLILFSILYSYAVLRYHFGKNISSESFLYVLNKGIAWTCASMLLLSVLPNNKLNVIGLTRRATGLIGYSVALIHVVITLVVFNQAYYPGFYSSNMINIHGWMNIFIGILSLICFSFPLFASFYNSKNSWYYSIGRYGVLLNISHVFSIGFLNWFPLSTWPCYLPPITMIFVCQGITILFYRYYFLRNN